MKYGLTSAPPIIQHGPVSTEQIELASELCRHKLQFTQNGLILGGGFVERCQVFSRADQNVRGRLRADVLEGEDVIILVNDFGRNLLGGDFAEKAVGVH
jgi:hypothetical protein